MTCDRAALVARSYSRGLAVMGAGVLVSPGSAESRFLRIAGAIVRHTGGGSRDRRRRNWGLDDDLRRWRRNIGRGAGFLGGFVGGSATTHNEKRDRKTQDANQRYSLFHLINLSHRDR